MVKGVAPRVGAWIETFLYIYLMIVVVSHPVWVRGLKHGLSPVYQHRYALCRTPCGCVD